MKNIIYCFLFFLIPLTQTYAQILKEVLTKATEYVEKTKRRDLYYDKDMKIVKESYYSESSQRIINTLYYNMDGNIDKIQGFKEYPKIYFEIDFKNGTYSYPEEKINLKFKGRFVFDGIQKGENIVVNYSNGMRNGKLIQTDYGVSGKQIVVYQKVDPKYLQFNIVKFYSELGTANSYKLFKGLSLNFNENLLNGTQTGFYVNGKIKFQSVFLNDKILNYTSFNVDGSLMSKIVADSNAIISRPYILNGTLNNEFSKKYIINKVLSSTGEISFVDDFRWEGGGWNNYREPAFVSDDGRILDFIGEIYNNGSGDFPNFYEKYKTDKRDIKKIFDKKKMMIHDDNPDALRVILYIPKFYIKRYDFDRNDQSDLVVY